MNETIFLTGAAGFIGCNFVHKIAANSPQYHFVIIDKLTYAGHLFNIEKTIKENTHLSFEKADITNREQLKTLFERYTPHAIINFAAESHVDRSIENPHVFLDTNIMGTMNLLNLSRELLTKNKFKRFVQVSTDEVYGQLEKNDPAFREDTPIAPSSPYSASKAGADLLVNAYHHTYGLDTVITRCSNNYGPYQNPEKLIPVMICKAFEERALPVYGKGENIRDWIHVDDHNRGIWDAFSKGVKGEVYNFGGDSELSNIELVRKLLKYMEKSEDLISFVTDRLGHDFRYAIDFSKAKRELDWSPQMSFEQGFKETIDWYLSHQAWIKQVEQKWSLGG